jgi:phage gp46-like protein
MPFGDEGCTKLNEGRRRVFWTTRPEACGEYTLCGNPCTIPGLEYEDLDVAYADPRIAGKDSGFRTIKNDDWLHSLMLNILNTRARTDVKCPGPWGVYGHWSESYRDDNLWIGTRLWNAAEKSYARCLDGVRAIRAAVEADMGKLIILGVADSVEVDAVYAGSNRVDITVIATTTQGASKINLSGAFVTGSWVWH